MVTVVIPSRNEPYLYQTTKDLLAKAKGEIEIWVILDGYWEEADKIIEDPRVHYIHFGEAKGMRNAINAGVAESKGEYIMKTDAHCLFSEGWDIELAKFCEPNWVVVPRRYALDPEKWIIEERRDNKYPVDYMYLSPDLHGVVWDEKNHDPALKKVYIDDTPSNQGSVWFMRKDHFEYLELMDEATYGTFWNEFQEIGLKVWLSGGRVIVNKNVYYAHWHKPSTHGRGYKLPEGEKEKTQTMVQKWLGNTPFWHKQKYSISWLKEAFPDMPGWKK